MVSPRELATTSSVVILAAWGALMKVSYGRQEAREKDVEAECGISARDYDRSMVLLQRASWRDHPMVAWAAENGAVWFQVLCSLSIFGPPDGTGSFLERFWTIIVGGLFRERLALALQYFIVNSLYGHHKFFDAKGDPEVGSFRELAVEFFKVTFASQSIFMLLPRVASKEAKAKIQAWSLAGDLRSFNPLAFCAKLAIGRSIVDVIFWGGHYIIHHPKAYVIHKTHHEHVHPNCFTNQHFSVPDLYIEAYFPMLSAIAALKSNVKLSLLEISLLSSYVFWLEGMSHAGKPVPASTMVPPLAPLYHQILGDIDRRNVEFHHYHHQALRCNYSITPWFDHLVGTTRFYPAAYNKAKQDTLKGPC